jgi:hypothetical protein
MEKAQVSPSDSGWITVSNKASPGTPWLHAFETDKNGDLLAINYEERLKTNGFELVRQSVQWPRLKGKCKEYRLDLSNVIRLSWFLKHGGKGHGSEIRWNFKNLRTKIAELKKARHVIRQYFGNPRIKGGLQQQGHWRECEARRLQIADPRAVPLSAEQQHHEKTAVAALDKYVGIQQKLIGNLYFTKVSDKLGQTYVCIPGIDGIPSRYWPLVIQLHKILVDVWHQQEGRDTTKETCPLTPEEQRRVKELHREEIGDKTIARIIVDEAYPVKDLPQFKSLNPPIRTLPQLERLAQQGDKSACDFIDKREKRIESTRQAVRRFLNPKH